MSNNTLLPLLRTYVGSRWLTLIPKGHETGSKPVLGHRVVVLVSSDGRTALVPKYGAAANDGSIVTKHHFLCLVEIDLHRQKDRKREKCVR